MNNSDIIIILLEIVIFIFAIVFHEYAHAITAYRCGDPTPKVQGRLSFNPIKHLDVLGLLMLFIVGVGFAKPVGINPAYFYDQDTCTKKVALAGPAINLIIGVMAGIINATFTFPVLITQILRFTYYINVGLGIFNLIPLWPLDGHHILLSFYPSLKYNFKQFKNISILILIFVFFTNLLNLIVILPTQLIYSWIQSTF